MADLEAWCIDPEGTNLATAADVDALIDAMIADNGEHSVAAIYSQTRPKTAKGDPDHELRIAVDNRNATGGIQYSGIVDEQPGRWYVRGTTADAAELLHYYFGHDEEWPLDSLVPPDLVRAAIKDFLTNGGERPTGEWKRWED